LLFLFNKGNKNRLYLFTFEKRKHIKRIGFIFPPYSYLIREIKTGYIFLLLKKENI